MTGDFNPVDVNQPYAERTYFKTRIAHEMLVAGFISTVLANKLPGPGTIYVKQELDFLAPVRMGDTITARVEITKVLVDKNRMTLRTTCVNQHGAQVLDGIAVVSPPRAGRAPVCSEAGS